MSSRYQNAFTIPDVDENEQGSTRNPLLPSTISTTMRDALFERFRNRIVHNPDLDRAMVSFQANKTTPIYSWFKYREGFSQQLVAYLLQKLMPQPGIVLDPFAGSGSTLFAAAEMGWESRGIEVLPVGVYAIQARMTAERIEPQTFANAVNEILNVRYVDYYDEEYAFNHIGITKGAFPPDEERELNGYLTYCNRQIEDQDAAHLLRYGAFCVLEEISYTRKDGQYLRWDVRAGRSRSNFNKGTIYTFRDAIEAKLHQMVNDLSGGTGQIPLFDHPSPQHLELSRHEPEILAGSCLELLPTMASESVDFILTSPPYANRYDYTRTYALELAFLGCSDAKVKQLRQTMLSCTVENRDKRRQLEAYYAQLGKISDFARIDETFHHQAALQEVLHILDSYRQQNLLNNSNIARLVRNYFYEMCFVIHELARLLRPGGVVALVNDNVRYAGEEIPVDLILSDMAETFGLTTCHIWTLGRGKGNSSQQMGSHGRTELRKCVYVWRKSN